MTAKVTEPRLIDTSGQPVKPKPGTYLVLQTRLIISTTISTNGINRLIEHYHYEHVVEREE